MHVIKRQLYSGPFTLREAASFSTNGEALNVVLTSLCLYTAAPNTELDSCPPDMKPHHMNTISPCLVHICLFARSLPVVQLDYRVLNTRPIRFCYLIPHSAAAVTTATVIESEGRRYSSGVVSQKYPPEVPHPHTITPSPHHC